MPSALLVGSNNRAKAPIPAIIHFRPSDTAPPWIVVAAVNGCFELGDFLFEVAFPPLVGPNGDGAVFGVVDVAVAELRFAVAAAAVRRFGVLPLAGWGTVEVGLIGHS
jgi:hypothetical protein